MQHVVFNNLVSVTFAAQAHAQDVQLRSILRAIWFTWVVIWKQTPKTALTSKLEKKAKGAHCRSFKHLCCDLNLVCLCVGAD